jgi:formiminotetrahydrofolate cyclodeaminase
MKNIENLEKDDGVKSGRRDFLKNAGRFAIYTPPAVMLLMRPSQATVLKSAVGKPCNDRNNDEIKNLSRSKKSEPVFKKSAKKSEPVFKKSAKKSENLPKWVKS